MRFCALAFWMACLAASKSLAQSPADGFTLSGRVVDQASGRPLSKIAVVITHSQQPGNSEGCITASDGGFSFEHLAAGKYNLSAQGRGYHAQAFRADDNYSTGIAVGPRLDSTHIMFPLLASGSISGTILEEQGDPVQRAHVWLFYRSVVAGRLQTRMRGFKTSDGRGSFHFGELRPGTYFIGVEARPWYADYAPGNADNPELDVAYPITFYAGTTDAAAASPITVTSGGQAQIEIDLHTVPAAHLHAPGSDATKRVQVGLQEVGPGGYRISVQPTFSRKDGIEIENIAPGHYIAQVREFSRNGAGRQLLGSKEVDIDGDTAIDISSDTALSITGSVAFEGERPAGPVHVVFLSLEAGAALSGTVQKDGTFEMNGSPFTGSRYSVGLQNAPGFYLKSISAKGGKFSQGELEMPGTGSVQLSLVVANGLSSVSGIALKDGKPFAGAMVLAMPDNFDRTDLISRDQSDSDGTFTLPNIAPGHYTILAIDNGRDLEYAEPSVIRPYLAAGRGIEAPLGNGSRLEVEVQARKR